MSTNKEEWGSHFGFIMVAIASAVGLGSVWRFPYMVGINGGSAFILIYTILTLSVGILGLAVEISIGRAGGINVVNSYANILVKSKIFGLISLITGFLIFMIYTVLGGWVLHYLVKLLTFQLHEITYENYFHQFIESVQPLYWQFLFIITTMFIVGQGIAKGIEKYSVFMNILLFILILIVAIRAVTLPNAQAGIEFLLKPDFTVLANPHVWLVATGQSLFSLSLGMAIMIAYGCYVPKNSNILQSGFIVSITTIGISILMGFAIFPAVFAMGFNPAEGPGLLFIILPQVFKEMPLGGIFATAFFIATFFAALTSAVSIIEPTISFVMTRLKTTRKKSTVFFSFIVLLFSLPVSLSFGVLKNISIYNLNMFNIINIITDNILLPFNLFLVFILAGWFWKPNKFLDELSNHQNIKLLFPKFLLWMVRIILPAIIIFTTLASIIQKIIK